MLYYIYDGSFEGLLTAIYEAYYANIKPDEILSTKDFQENLFSEPVYIKTDIAKFIKVADAIKTKISISSLENIFYAFLSDLEGASTLIYKYIQLGFKLKSKTDLHMHNEIILYIHKIRKKVDWERIRMLGFIRFHLISKELYYAAMEPDHNILELICPHFAQRLPNENWMIHDIKREKAAIYNKKEWLIIEFPKDRLQTFASENHNDLYDALWKTYFKSATIQNRINPKLQKGHMPVRYWKYLNETK